MHSFKGWQNNKIHAFPSKRCISNKNHVFCSGNLSHKIPPPHFNHILNFHFLTNGKDITASLRLRSNTTITTLTLWGHYYGKWGLSEHQHCNNTITNVNSRNARSRMKTSSAGKYGCSDKGRWVKYWACLGCWISPCYGLYSLGMHFETYEQFISLIFQFFFGLQ